MTWGVGGKKSASPATTYRVIMSFHFDRGWRVTFFEDDRRRDALPRLAFFNCDETLLDSLAELVD
jgi:hypothetical protein